MKNKNWAGSKISINDCYFGIIGVKAVLIDRLKDALDEEARKNGKRSSEKVISKAGLVLRKVFQNKSPFFDFSGSLGTNFNDIS